MEAAIGNSQSVTELLEKGESISETSYRGWTALHYAAQGGQEGIVDLLVTKGAEINAQGNRGETALNLATYHCHRLGVRMLLEKGANVANKFNTNNALWLAPIFNASGNGCDPTILKYLLNAGADPNETEPGYGYSPLMFSANIKDCSSKCSVALCRGRGQLSSQ